MKVIYILIPVLMFAASCKKDPSITPPPVIPVVETPRPPFVWEITVYPNPCNGIFSVITNDTIPDNLQMYDALGKSILTQTISGRTVFDMAVEPSGIYMLVITGSKGRKIEKIIIEH